MDGEIYSHYIQLTRGCRKLGLIYDRVWLNQHTVFGKQLPNHLSAALFSRMLLLPRVIDSAIHLIHITLYVILGDGRLAYNRVLLELAGSLWITNVVRTSLWWNMRVETYGGWRPIRILIMRNKIHGVEWINMYIIFVYFYIMNAICHIGYLPFIICNWLHLNTSVSRLYVYRVNMLMENPTKVWT